MTEIERPNGNYDRRLTQLEDEAFDRAVSRATATVSQNLAKIHRRRLVVQTATVVATLILAIGGLVVFLTRQSAITNTRHDTAYVCRVVADVSSVMNDFVTRDAHLRIAQQQTNAFPAIIKGFKKIVSNATITQAIAESNALNEQATNYWLTVDVPKLVALSKANCNLK